MGIFDTLLTGGLMVGRVCQALNGKDSKRYKDKETGVTVQGIIKFGDATFYRSDDNSNREPYVYVLNTNVKNALSIGIANTSDSNGLTYTIPGGKALGIPEVDDERISPLTELSINSTPSESMTEAGPRDSCVNLSFSNLNIGKKIAIGSFKLTCTTTHLSIITSGIVLTAISYFKMLSDKGISARYVDKIKPSSFGIKESGDENEYTFDIDFAKLGFDMNNDYLSGDIDVVLGDNADIMKISPNSKPRQLTPIENKFFELLEKEQL